MSVGCPYHLGGWEAETERELETERQQRELQESWPSAVELPHYEPVSSQEKNHGIKDTILLSSGPPILCQPFYIFEPNKNQGVK